MICIECPPVRRHNAYTVIRISYSPNDGIEMNLFGLEKLLRFSLNDSFETTRIYTEEVVIGKSALIRVKCFIVILQRCVSVVLPTEDEKNKPLLRLSTTTVRAFVHTPSQRQSTRQLDLDVSSASSQRANIRNVRSNQAASYAVLRL